MSTAPAPSARPMDAKALRAHIESTHGGRLAGALTPVPRQVCELIPTRIAAMDEMLGGGVPLGAITELVGPPSSGRTGVALSVMASAMREGYLCAWVDASDALDPESAAANGVQLDQLLWVRCGVQARSQVVQTTGGTRAGEPSTQTQTQTQARSGHHPRDEARGLDRAVGALLGRSEDSPRRDRSIGTPGAPNRPLDGSRSPSSVSPGARQTFRPVPREEQVSSDRQPRRRPANPPAPVHPVQEKQVTVSRPAKPSQGAGSPWARLDQALQAADLLLQAGGFRVLVLDLGSIAPEHALRIPMATWFRFRAAAEASRTALLTIGTTNCAKSSAGLVVCFESLVAQSWPSEENRPPANYDSSQKTAVLHFPSPPTLDRAASDAENSEAKRAVAKGNLIESVRYQARTVRQRFEAAPDVGTRRPPQATWQLSACPLREAGSV